MKISCIILSALLLSQILAVSATLDQFLPWVAPCSLVLGTPKDDFMKVRPAAMDISGKERNPGAPFNGSLYEKMQDDSYFVYIFLDDKFAAASWGAPASAEVAKKIIAIRSSLIQTSGEPTSGTTGRVKKHGGIAPIIWEQYRPRMDQNYRITLKANSESGIEVDLINELDASKRGIRTIPSTYEDVVQSLPKSVQLSGGTSVLVDLLNEIRTGSLSSPSGAHNPKRESNVPVNQNAQPLESETDQETKSATISPNKEQSNSTSWSHMVLLIFAAIGALFFFLKRRSVITKN